MTDKSVLVLAAGEQRRWKGHDRLKQLLRAGPEMIIDRIVRQVRERGHEPIIVTHKYELMRSGVQYVVPINRRWKVESLIDIKEYWGNKSTLILLGDVIFQGYVIDRIFDNSDETMFFGNLAEIFAFSFIDYEEAIDRFNTAFRECLINGDKGTLHTIYRSYIEDFTSTSIENYKYQRKLFTHVTGDGGFTRDIDSPEDYDRFIEEVINKNRLDDLPRSNH